MSKQIERLLDAVEAVERVCSVRALHHLDKVRKLPGAEQRDAVVRIHEIERRCAEELNS